MKGLSHSHSPRSTPVIAVSLNFAITIILANCGHKFLSHRRWYDAGGIATTTVVTVSNIIRLAEKSVEAVCNYPGNRLENTEPMY